MLFQRFGASAHRAAQRGDLGVHLAAAVPERDFNVVESPIGDGNKRLAATGADPPNRGS